MQKFVCRECGKEFQSANRTCWCSTCAPLIRPIKVCQVCGTKYELHKGRSKCPGRPAYLASIAKQRVEQPHKPARTASNKTLAIIDAFAQNPSSTMQEIANSFGVSRPYVQQLLKRVGISKRPIRETRTCKGCGASFSVVPSSPRRYCDECKSNGNSRGTTGAIIKALSENPNAKRTEISMMVFGDKNVTHTARVSEVAISAGFPKRPARESAPKGK